MVVFNFIGNYWYVYTTNYDLFGIVLIPVKINIKNITHVNELYKTRPKRFVFSG